MVQKVYYPHGRFEFQIVQLPTSMWESTVSFSRESKPEVFVVLIAVFRLQRSIRRSLHVVSHANCASEPLNVKAPAFLAAFFRVTDCSQCIGSIAASYLPICPHLLEYLFRRMLMG